MKTFDLFFMSVRNLWRRKLRTSLTILGVVIGTSSIILMLSIGIAMDKNFEDQISQMGSLTVISVSPKQYEDPKAPKLDDKALEEFAKIEGVQRVIPTLRVDANLIFGKYKSNWNMEVIGMDAEDMQALSYEVDQGRNMNVGEKNAIVLGFQIPMNFSKIGTRPNWNSEPEPMPFEFDKDIIEVDVKQYDYDTGKPVVKDMEGNTIKVDKNLKFKVIGITPEMKYDISYSVFVSKEAFNKIVQQKKKYEEKLYGKQNSERGNQSQNKYNDVKVKVVDRKQVEAVQKAIEEKGYYAYSSMDSINEMKKMSGNIQMALGGIGAISLLVAAIGITNTMMMSIYERTKEIGVMKVIGARISDIQKLFLLEAVMIGLLGGIIGLLFSLTLSFIMNTLAPQMAQGFLGLQPGGKISIISPWLGLLAVGFATLIGLISGYFPARRAMKLSALSAIRTE